jgi:hypothetical protein
MWIVSMGANVRRISEVRATGIFAGESPNERYVKGSPHFTNSLLCSSLATWYGRHKSHEALLDMSPDVMAQLEFWEFNCLTN